MRFYTLCIFALIIPFSCTEENKTNSIPQTEFQIAKEAFRNDYVQLPEKAVSSNLDSTVLAQYTMPTEKYGHGILGDRTEAEQLVVLVENVIYEYTLPEEFVFEDIRPRLFDVDGDDELEFITIRTHIDKGAGIAIFKIVNGRLNEYAFVEEIGTRNRWLNIASIEDLDNDGTVEIAWIQTPHIGGILKVAKIQEGALDVLSENAQYSNHGIGERNLCLSVLTEGNDKRVLYVPSQNRTKIVGFTFENSSLIKEVEISQSVDFSEVLYTQYNFGNVLEDEVNCIK